MSSPPPTPDEDLLRATEILEAFRARVEAAARGSGMVGSFQMDYHQLAEVILETRDAHVIEALLALAQLSGAVPWLVRGGQ